MKKSQQKLTDFWIENKILNNQVIEREKISIPVKQFFRCVSESAKSEKENDHDDEIIKSSQTVTESELRKKINKSMQGRVRTKRLQTYKFTSSTSSLDIPSINDQEIKYTNEEFIEMVHDVDAFIINDTLLGHSSIGDQSDYKKTSEDDCSKKQMIDGIVEKKNMVNTFNSPKKVASTKKKSVTTKIKNRECITDDPKLSQILIKKLFNLKINLQHEVPPQHSALLNKLSRPLNKEETIAFEKYGLLKRGAYTKSEDKIIQENWKNFCLIHKWDVKNVKPFLNVKYGEHLLLPLTQQRYKFVQFLANGLPWRNLYSIYTRFKNLYNIHKNSGKFTNKDDLIIMNYWSKSSKDGMSSCISALAKKLNRKKSSVYMHIQLLKKKNDLTGIHKKSTNKKVEKKKIRKKLVSNHDEETQQVRKEIKWTYPVVRKFVGAMIEVNCFGDTIELKNQNFNKKIWKEIEKKINIDYTILRNFWCLQLHMQLFCANPIYLNDMKIELINYLYEKQCKKVEYLKWEDISLDFDGTTSMFLSRIFDNLVKYAKKTNNTHTLEEIIDYLYHHHISEILERETDVILPKLDCKLRSDITVTEKILQNKLN